MKIYTRTGDAGTTGLFGGDRVVKTHPRIEAYGTVDETNSHVGMARSFLVPEAAAIDGLLASIQSDLFILGADLATPTESRAQVPRITESHVERLEREIDGLDDDLPPLRVFILPGGTPAGAALHVARTVCRRAERLTITAADSGVSRVAAVYLNRLSDLLFVAARWINAKSNVPEDAWHMGNT